MLFFLPPSEMIELLSYPREIIQAFRIAASLCLIIRPLFVNVKGVNQLFKTIRGFERQQKNQ
jgi:hypothetical protein